MKLSNKYDIINLVSWIFFATVILRALYVGLKYGCWLGLVAAIAGFIGGLVYAKYRKV